MFVCENCGASFEEPKIHKERYPYGMSYVTEDFAVCPYCNGDITEAKQCRECYEYFPAEEVDEDWLCKSCREVLGDD